MILRRSKSLQMTVSTIGPIDGVFIALQTAAADQIICALEDVRLRFLGLNVWIFGTFHYPIDLLPLFLSYLWLLLVILLLMLMLSLFNRHHVSQIYSSLLPA